MVTGNQPNGQGDVGLREWTPPVRQGRGMVRAAVEEQLNGRLGSRPIRDTDLEFVARSSGRQDVPPFPDRIERHNGRPVRYYAIP